MTDIYTSIHIIAPRPTVDVSPETYPSLTIREDFEATINVTINGNESDRRAFADALRVAADFFDSWTEADGLAAEAEPEAVPA